jgi:hypothetical protein
VVLHPQALAAAGVAQTVRQLSNRATGTTPVLVLDKGGDKNRMHEVLHSTRSVRLSGGDLRLCMHNASKC